MICVFCEGNGYMLEKVEDEPSFTTCEVTCPSCGGTGEIFKPEEADIYDLQLPTE